MRICIYGAGGIGGHFAVRLAKAGHQVSVIARGENLSAIRDRGLTLLSGEAHTTVQPEASEDPTAQGIQDLVVIGLKATGLAELATRLAPLIGPETRVLFPQNGMPWWYPTGLPADRPPPPDLPMFRLQEPFLSILGRNRILGGLVYSGNEMVAPGTVRNTTPGGNRIDIGPICETGAAAAAEIRSVFAQAGIDAPKVEDIRAAMWKKLILNMSGSVIALATQNDSSVSRKDPALGAVYRRVIREGLSVASAHGYPLGDDGIDPGEMLRRLLDHKPSLLQDYEQGRMMELHEIVQAPLAFAGAADLDTPGLEVLAAIVMRLGRDRGLVPD